MVLSAFSAFDALCNEALTLIEVEEAKLLNWGFFDVRNNVKMHLRTLIEKLPPTPRQRWRGFQEEGKTTDDILQNLLERKLIFKISVAGQEFYRTRFAEAIRLLYLLRQRFSFDDWQTASRLVSDVKIQLQPRHYPRRDITSHDLIDELKQLHLNPIFIEAVRLLLQDTNGEPLSIARFQKEAILQQARNLSQRGERALVIGAGTGSGKTKAFYVPALAEIAMLITTDNWVKALALYPRTELLKDQFAEAFSEARKLDQLLKKRGQRGITLGAYYADTPASAARFLTAPPQSWSLHHSRSGWVCPFFFCPNPDCPSSSHELLWDEEDLKKEREENENGHYGRYARLRCPTCDFEVTSKHIFLTREQMVRQPPDILFTTTEMLNRRLSRAAEHHLFGIAAKKPPKLVLLDEIHTYEGIFGAQVAYLLRRWRHAYGPSYTGLCFVGLSATLTSAETFFSKLTGIPLHRVSYICPRDTDLIDEGIEYNIVLKGDPVSGTSLLSTSVQTAMLLGRMLDPATHPSKGAYGTKIFAFADKLDVLMRWYHIEQEAEGQRTLSQYRDVDEQEELALEERRQRFLTGQLWSVCKDLGHELREPLRLDITSSQYRGVDPNANLVIATSTLEVGFNDPAVGAIIQHKAPRSHASFLQRKGRAGRRREMRPWMIVVASAYGRDRWTFQHTENLFDAQIEDINLPLENYYVRKIQATYALMDWLTYMLKQEGYHHADLWKLLSSDDKEKATPLQQQQRNVIRDILEGLLRGTQRAHFEEYIKNALGIEDADAVAALLWREPRSLFFEVIPTLIRQLATNWQRIEGGVAHAWTDAISKNPMPDFMPSTLFADLNVPELLLHLPDKPTNMNGNVRRTSSASQREDEQMPLYQAITEFAPGHVNKRYARKHRTKEAHWLELPDDAQLSRDMLPLQYLKIDRADLSETLVVDETAYQVYRPHTYTLGVVPEHVKSSSTGHIAWRSHFLPNSISGAESATTPEAPASIEDGTSSAVAQLTLTSTSPWRRFFSRISSYTQTHGSWVEITRLATSVHVETFYERGKGLETRNRILYFEENSQPAALGFTIYADALRFEFLPLDVTSLLESTHWPSLYQHLGPEFFLYKLQHDIRLAEAKLSTFEISWLWQLELSMLVGVAVAKQWSMEESAQEVRSTREALADHALRAIFQSLQGEEDENETERVGRLHKKLVECMRNPLVQDALNDNETVLWQRHDSQLVSWLQHCYASSLGATLFTALVQVLPDIDAESLVMDVEGNSIWISEKTSGGIGLISHMTDALALRPREFDLQMSDVLHHCERAELAQQLFALADLVEQEEASLLQAFALIREGSDLPKQLEVRQTLTHILEQHGIAATRELIVALNAKFLRPNSSRDTDRLIATIARRWQQEEERIGCSIDLRVMAVAALRIPEIEQQVREVLQRIGGDAPKMKSQVFNLLQSLLWCTCHDSCPSCIEEQHQYQQLARPSRALLLAVLAPQDRPIVYGTSHWEEQVQSTLASTYFVQVYCEQQHLEEGKKALLDMLTKPVEVGFQLFYPRIERLDRTARGWLIDVSIRELIYA